MPDSLETGRSSGLTGQQPAGLLPPTHRRSILCFCAAAFFYWTSLYLYVPVLPIYAQSLGASLSMVGVVIASYALPQLLLRIPVGLCFDSIRNRKALVALGLVTASAGALGLGLAGNVWHLCLARALTGAAAAAWVAFTVLLTSYYPQESAARAIGLINSVNGTAMVVATSSGGAIAEMFGYRHAFLTAAVLGLVGLLALSFAIQPPVARRPQSISRRSFRQVATHPLLLTVTSIAILAQFANFAGIFGFTPVYAASIGASSADLGIITMMALAASVVAALTSVRVAERWGYTFTIALGAVLMGGGLLSIPSITSIYLLGAVQLAIGFGRGTLNTTTMALTIYSAPPEQRATAMGVYQALYAIGMIAGPLVSGSLADSFGLSSVFYLCASLCLVIAAIAFLPIVPRR